MKKENKLQIRNSTAEFLIFTRQAGEDGIDVRVAEETVWLTQPLIAELFQTTVPNISMHLRSIYETGELTAEATLKNFLTVRQEGTRQVRRNLEYYNLDAIIAVGFREELPHREGTEVAGPLCDDVSRLRRGSGREEHPDDHGRLGQ